MKTLIADVDGDNLLLKQPYEQIEDYKILSKAIDWTSYFDKCYERSGRFLNLLDIGCGTGRWLSEFQKQLNREVSWTVKCDLMDPSAVALKNAAKVLHPPLFLERPIQNTIQHVELTRGKYDVIWAVHSFYSLAANELGPILKNCFYGMREGGHLFIVLSSRASFYYECYKNFRSSYSINQVATYYDAETLQKDLKELGLDVEVFKTNYVERVPIDDLQRLSHYILNECIGYSFDRDNEIIPQLHIQDLLNHFNMGPFLRSYVVEGNYEFPQDVWIIHTKKRN